MKTKHKVLPLFYRKSPCTQFIILRVLAANPILLYTELVTKGCPEMLYKYLSQSCVCLLSVSLFLTALEYWSRMTTKPAPDLFLLATITAEVFTSRTRLYRPHTEHVPVNLNRRQMGKLIT